MQHLSFATGKQFSPLKLPDFFDPNLEMHEYFNNPKRPWQAPALQKPAIYSLPSHATPLFPSLSAFPTGPLQRLELAALHLLT
jgi:hypothetical protein